MKSVTIRPQVGIFQIFEAVDYKPWFALAEFVDNSIQSYLDSWEVLVGSGSDGALRVSIDASPEEVLITDDAGGIGIDDPRMGRSRLRHRGTSGSRRSERTSKAC
jgi:hypothetical protein